MSDLSFTEKIKLERLLAMGSGYVLNFSNRTFAEFIYGNTGANVYDAKYSDGGDSKANRLRTFWDVEPNHVVGKLLDDISQAWDEVRGCSGESELPEEYLRIVQRLKRSMPILDLPSIIPDSEDKSFEVLARSVRESIEKNEPEAGLDRLHTYLVKYFRFLCRKHDIEINREKPLHSLVGEYIKKLKSKGLIESEMTERILKSSISTLEAFNRVRNEHSFAHDNEVLNYNESLLIFSHVTSSMRFTETLENRGCLAICKRLLLMVKFYRLWSIFTRGYPRIQRGKGSSPLSTSGNKCVLKLINNRLHHRFSFATESPQSSTL